MELRHLEYFVAVAEELSFTGAARRLHVVQSGVSATIRDLEREVGAALFDRSPQRVELTGAGAALLPEALATLDAARGALDAVRASRGVVRGTLHIGYLTAVRLLDLPSLLESFHTEHPDVALRLRVSPSGSAGLARSLLAGRLDLAILSLPGAPGRPPAGLTLRQVASVPMVLVVPAGHRLAARDAVSLADLADEQFIDFPVGYGNRDLIDRAFATTGIERRVALEVTDISAASAFVRHRLGIAFLPEFAALPDEAGVRVLSLLDAPLRFDLHVATATARRPSAALEALLQHVERLL
ncbi:MULTISPECIES: LysR family transcriptional regulator [Streptomyces]|uniref:LysR family transcriptional regulator n=1 Tax=Streptomyces TaxID=1883 RepID=UPI001D0B6734|nr:MULTISPECIES: LysR family transcriptional regulator [Streptomyces]MCX5079653.1 LysR family transcriptional regulator [Streptomyces sp. NBC_00401]UDL97941.1 LysR family transcriptional regulator [Streptomyces longhuiensis]